MFVFVPLVPRVGLPSFYPYVWGFLAAAILSISESEVVLLFLEALETHS